MDQFILALIAATAAAWEPIAYNTIVNGYDEPTFLGVSDRSAVRYDPGAESVEIDNNNHAMIRDSLDMTE